MFCGSGAVIGMVRGVIRTEQVRALRIAVELMWGSEAELGLREGIFI